MAQGGMIHFTKKSLEALPFPDKGSVFYRDEDLAGFGLRVFPGKKTFILEKRVQGLPKRMTIGEFGPFSLDQARTKALEMLSLIAQGKDPEEIHRPHGPTFGDLIKTYRERHIPQKLSGFKDEQMIANFLQKWEKRKLAAIKRKDIAILHSEVGRENGHYTANRLLALIRKMFNEGAKYGLCDEENPATKIEKFKEQSRERFIQPDELPKFLEALKTEPNIYIRGALVTMLFTGARKSEVLKMKWEDVDLNQGVWRIPTTKPGRSLTLPIPAPIIDLLKSLPTMHNNPFVFCGHKRKSPLHNVYKNFKAIIQAAGLKDLRPHDLRRTLGSWLAGAGQSLPIIGRALGHTQAQTTQIYARLNLDPVRAALNQTAEKMLAVASAEKKEETDETKSE
jgi:integrase